MFYYLFLLSGLLICPPLEGGFLFIWLQFQIWRVKFEEPTKTYWMIESKKEKNQKLKNKQKELLKTLLAQT